MSDGHSVKPPLDNAHGSPDPPPTVSGASFMGIPLRGWAITLISGVAVFAAMGTTIVKLYQQVQDHKAIDTTIVAQKDALQTEVNAVTKTTSLKLSEAEKHLRKKDHFDTFPIDNDPEVVTAEYYPSDGCVHITRKKTAATGKNPQVYYGQAIQDEWILDPSQAAPAHAENQSQPAAETQESGLDLNAGAIRSAVWDVHKRTGVGNSTDLPKFKSIASPKLKRAKMFQGSCLNPHPGQFQFFNQQINACEVQVWRTFGDGCKHYQMYNACTGQWAPNVVWTYCNLQHAW